MTGLPGSARGSSKSRLNFLDLLRAGHTDYVLNDAAFDYMRDRDLSRPLIAASGGRTGQTHFADQAAWLAHLDRLGIVRRRCHARYPVVRSPPRGFVGQHPCTRFPARCRRAE